MKITEIYCPNMWIGKKSWPPSQVRCGLIDAYGNNMNYGLLEVVIMGCRIGPLVGFIGNYAAS
jgi:hypothetical protein